MKEQFIDINFRQRTLDDIATINSVLDEYQSQGYALTLRQLHYQFVARGLRPNTEKTYTYLGAKLRDGRMAGLIDWDAIEDRTRETIRWANWKDPAHLIRVAKDQYAEDPWREHDVRLFVWIEKAAIANLVERACRDYSVPYFSVRGYNSLSEMYSIGKEFEGLIEDGIRPVVLYLGDHDPSGIHMPRNAAELLSTVAGDGIEVQRLGLNLDQVRSLRLPANPVKEKDKRTPAYIREFGFRTCWEVDALEPSMIDNLVREAIEGFIIKKKWKAAKAKEKKNKALLDEMVSQMNGSRR